MAAMSAEAMLKKATRLEVTHVPQIEIIFNGEPLSTSAATLAALVDEQGFGGVRVATARNGEFVAERLRAGMALAPGDQIEVVSARQGG